MNAIRFVPTGIHAYFDYIGGVGLIAAPFVFGFSSIGGAAVLIPMVLGVGLILYSLLTNYELGIPGLKFIPMTYHLVFDFVACVFLAASPFLFGFINQAPNAWLPHIILGVGVILLVMVTQTRYQPKKGQRRHNPTFVGDLVNCEEREPSLTLLADWFRSDEPSARSQRAGYSRPKTKHVS